MDKSTDPYSLIDRRKVLAASGGIGAVSLAGCLGDDRPEGNAPEEIDRVVLGADNGDVPTLMLFEDYGCPHCKTFNEETLPRLIEDYVETGRLKIAHYDFPLPVRQNSNSAAQSGWVMMHLAPENFWEYKSFLFANQDQLGYELYREAANEVGVDGEEVVNETRSRAYRSFVQDDKAYGQELGVQGTPALFIGETQIPPGPYNALVNEIEQQLQ